MAVRLDDGESSCAIGSHRSRVASALAATVAVMVLAGCPQASGTPGGSGSAAATTAAADGDRDYAVVFNDAVLDDPLGGLDLPEIPTDVIDRETFEPPATKDDLVAAHEWTDNPVLDGYALLAEKKAKIEPFPIEKAIGMKNDSPEDNEKLVRAFGQFPQSKDEIDYDAELRLTWAADAKTTNPILGSSVSDFELTGFMSIGLFGLDRDLNSYATAETVKSWRTSADRTVDLFELRDDLFWSDGTPVTAEDFAFSYRAIINPKVPAVAMRTGTDELVDVVAYDATTLAFFHSASKATNIFNANFGVLPSHIYSKTIEDDPSLRDSDRHVELEESPVVAGPYRIRRRIIDQEIVLERREEYYRVNGEDVRDKPHFKTIRVKIITDSNTALLALKKGDIDYLEGLKPAQWDGQTNDDEFYERNTKLSGLEWVYMYFGWNHKTPYFEDRRVRRAMSLAFDHEEFLNTVTYGLYEPSTGPFHQTAWFAPDDVAAPLTQDLDAAEDLLAEAGWVDSDDDGTLDKDGRPFEFTMIVPSSDPSRIAAANLMKQNLDQIGVRMIPKVTEFTTLMQLTRDHEFDAFAGGWGTGADPDLGKNIWGSAAAEGGRNYIYFANDGVDTLYDHGLYEFDREKRGRIYGRIGELIWAEQPYTFLYFRSTFVGMSNKLRGITFSSRGPLGFSGGFAGLWKPKE